MRELKCRFCKTNVGTCWYRARLVCHDCYTKLNIFFKAKESQLNLQQEVK